MPLRVLLTGFEPFHGAPRNPSGDAARALDGARIEPPGAEVIGRVLPVLWDVAAARLRALVAEVRPHVALSLGMAQGTFRVERVATDARRPIEDNAGRLPSPLREAPTVALPTRLPVERLEAAIAAAGGPVEPSEDAGGFLCNEVFLALLRAMDGAPGLLRAGFLHVPNDRHVPEPIAQESVNAAVLAALRATLAEPMPAVRAQWRW
ncbi:MAG: pyroglutamyl-peptidase I [Polyangiaceae bacterium]|nr:pyroglutamyl-peptidase I [Polyangiaceae bacterium]